MINEARVISAIVNNQDIAPAISASHVDFLFTSHKDIWDFVKNYYYQNRQIVPAQVLQEQFRDFNLIETSGTVRHYLEQLRTEYTSTMLDRISRGIAADLQEKPVNDILSALNKYVMDLNNVSIGVKDLDITDTEKALEHYIETKQLMEERGGVLGIRSGYDSVDANYPTGLYSGHYIMLMSRTNQGKSWIALDMAVNAWAQMKKVLYVSLEMTAVSVRDRAYTIMSSGEFTMSDLSRAQVDIDQMKLWSEGNLTSNVGFVVSSSDGLGGMTPGQLQAKIDQYSPDIVFIDYLQLLSDNRNSSGETERIRNASKELKQLAMANDLPIVAVVSASSHETKEYNTPPQVYEIAGSRQAAFDADLVLSLISKKQPDGTTLTEIVARKNRQGPLFDFFLKMDVNNGKIVEYWGDDEGFTE